MTSMLLRHSPIAVRTLASRAVSPSTCNATGGSSQETGTAQGPLGLGPLSEGVATGPDDLWGGPPGPGHWDPPRDPPKIDPPADPPGDPPGPPKNKTDLESGPMKPAKIYIV